LVKVIFKGCSLSVVVSYPILSRGRQPIQIKLENLEQLLLEYKTDVPTHATEDQTYSRETFFKEVHRYVGQSDSGQALLLFIKAPTFAKIACTLFPTKIKGILLKFNEPQSQIIMDGLCSTLDSIAEKDPWKFGFGEVHPQIPDY
jgi:hypothetical protein